MGRYVEITLIRRPTIDDWMLVKECALVTVGKAAKTEPDEEWKRRILRARHSPIRELKFVFLLDGIPSWVATHLSRHHEGVQPYIMSQRNDRQKEYDRNAARQDAPVRMIWSLNAEGLMNVANKRLCMQTSEETRGVVQEMCCIAEAAEPALSGLLVPMCVYHGGICHEMHPCRRRGDE